jgi:hypothetical protein
LEAHQIIAVMSAFRVKQTCPFAEFRFRGRYWGQSGHGLYKKVAAPALRLFFFA